MKRPEFTFEQEEWICEALGDWYVKWKGKMTENHKPHYLGIAMEQLKLVLCGNLVNTLVEDIVRQKSDKKLDGIEGELIKLFAKIDNLTYELGILNCAPVNYTPGDYEKKIERLRKEREQYIDEFIILMSLLF